MGFNSVFKGLIMATLRNKLATLLFVPLFNELSWRMYGR